MPFCLYTLKLLLLENHRKIKLGMVVYVVPAVLNEISVGECGFKDFSN